MKEENYTKKKRGDKEIKEKEEEDKKEEQKGRKKRKNYLNKCIDINL